MGAQTVQERNGRVVPSQLGQHQKRQPGKESDRHAEPHEPGGRVSQSPPPGKADNGPPAMSEKSLRTSGASAAGNVALAVFGMTSLEVPRRTLAPLPQSRYFVGATAAAAIAFSCRRAFSKASSMLKLAGFWRGGNSWNVLRNSPTIACAGTSRNARSTIHLL